MEILFTLAGFLVGGCFLPWIFNRAADRALRKGDHPMAVLIEDVQGNLLLGEWFVFKPAQMQAAALWRTCTAELCLAKGVGAALDGTNLLDKNFSFKGVADFGTLEKKNYKVLYVVWREGTFQTEAGATPAGRKLVAQPANFFSADISKIKR